MDIYSLSASQLFFNAVLFVFGFYACIKIGSNKKVSYIYAATFYLWHTAFSMIYMIYTINNGGDAIAYYIKSFSENIEFSLGTKAVICLTSLLTNYFNLSLIGCFLFFNILGSIGGIYFAASIKHVTQNYSRKKVFLWSLIVFVPSYSFWTSAIGKDSINALAVGMVIWSSFNISKRFIIFVSAFLLALLVRPHIAGFMIFGLAALSLLSPSISKLSKVIIGAVASVAIMIMVPLILNYGGISSDGSTDSDELMDYVEKRQSYNMSGGGSIDIASMSYPEQLFAYVARPLPYEAHSMFSFIASIDNLILFFIFSAGIISMFRNSKFIFSKNHMFLIVYGLVTWSVLALTTANSGIAVRQKWMFVPVFIVLFLSIKSLVLEKRAWLRGAKS